MIKNKIFLKLLGSILLFTLIPLVGLAIYNFVYTAQNLKKQTKKILKNKAIHQSEILQKRLVSRIKLIRAWSHLSVIQSNLDSDDAEGEISKFLADSSETHSCFKILDCVNPQKSIVSSSLASRISTEEKLKKRNLESRPVQLKKQGGKLFLIIQAPIYPRGQKSFSKPLGYLMGNYNIHGLVKEVLPQNGSIVLALGSLKIGAEKLEKLPSGLKNSSGQTDSQGEYFSQSAPVLLGQGIHPLTVFALQKREAILQSNRALFWTNLWIVGGVFLVIFCFTYWIARQFTRPIIQISTQVEHIAKSGDLDQRLHLQRNDELGELARQFDSLCESLQKYRSLQLEQRSFLEEMTLKAAQASAKGVLLLGFDWIHRGTQAEVALGYICNHQGIFQVEKSHGIQSKDLRSASYRVGEGLVGKVAELKKPLLLSFPPEKSGMEIDNGFYVYPPPHVFFIPVIYRESPIAVFALGRMHPFEDATQEGAIFIANQLSIGYDSALKAESLLQRAEKIEKQNQEILKQRTFLEKLNEDLQRASRHKSEFLSSMSHELRTPLNSMIGYTSLVLSKAEGLLPPAQIKNLNHAHRSSLALLQLINDVLDFSKIEAGKMEVSIEEFELDELIEDCLITARGYLQNQKKELDLLSDIPENLPLVESDYTKVEQICNNILSNAIKFTKEGGIKIIVEKVGEEFLALRIEDTGCGISEEQIPHIFESFKQLDGSTKKRFGGTGLGMAITHRFCTMLGIKIGIQSQLGKGTTFTLTLPLKFVEQDPQTSSVKEVVSSSETKIPPTQPLKSKPLAIPSVPTKRLTLPPSSPEEKLKTIYNHPTIVCMGQRNLFDALTQQLSDLPFQVAQVNNVEECLDQCSASDLIWAIVMEPSGSGFETLARLKAEEISRDIPVIMSSIQEDIPLHLGRVECLMKPVQKNQLLRTLIGITPVEKGKVLVVEDHKPSLELYGAILSDGGYTAQLAGSGEEAIQFLTTATGAGDLPQAMILDLLMPGINGFGVLEEIQKHPPWKKIPLVVVTGKDLTSEEIDLLNKGTQGLLKKGKFSPQELSQHIESVVKTVELGGVRSILVVDDNEINLDLLVTLFEDAGYRVYRALSGKEAIKISREQLPDIIFMDLAMPEMDGFETSIEIKRNPLTAGISIVACSAFTLPEYKERAYRVGCDGYVTKPIEPKFMLDQVDKYALLSLIKRRLKWQKSS